MYICICVYVYMWICVYMYIRIHVYMCICIYVYMYICIYVDMYICIDVYLYTIIGIYIGSFVHNMYTIILMYVGYNYANHFWIAIGKNGSLRLILWYDGLQLIQSLIQFTILANLKEQSPETPLHLVILSRFLLGDASNNAMTIIFLPIQTRHTW